MSVSTYTVEEILGQREWAPADDPSKKTIFFEFRAAETTQVCTVGRKPGNELKVGESFEATATEDRGKLKLKRVQPNPGFRSQKEDPQKSARIGRMHSQEMALRAVDLGVSVNIQERPESFEDLLKLVRRTSDYFDRDVQQAVADRPLQDAQQRGEEKW